MEMITISSRDGLTDEVEPNPDPNNGLFPNNNRCLKFNNKKTIVLTSRVHPGETPGTHVLNGFIELLIE